MAVRRCTVSPRGSTPKRRYGTERAATDAAIKRALAHPGLSLRAYRCQHCGGWHLTKRPYRPGGA